MLKGFEHAWICSKCQNEASVVTGKDYDEIENKLKNKRTNCCGAEYEYIGFRPIIENITTGPILKADEDYQPPIEEFEEVVEEIIRENDVIQEEVNEEKIENDNTLEDAALDNSPVNENNNLVDENNELINEVQTETKEPEIQNIASNASFNIDDLVIPGPKGVSNAQMIPAMKIAIKENSKDKLEIIKSHYPDVFQGSIKYIGKKMQEQLKVLGF